MSETLPDFPTVERLLSLLTSTPTYLHCQQGFDTRLDVLAHDICFYTRELQRSRYTPTAGRIATA